MRLLRGRPPYKVIRPRNTHKVNDLMVRWSRDAGGGKIVLKGNHQPEEPFYLQPGIVLEGPYHPTLYSKTPNVRPRFENAPVFQFEDGIRYGPRKAWGGAQLRNFQVDPQTEGLTLINGVGGNGSLIENVSSAMGRYPLLYGVRVNESRDHDFQYSTLDRVRCTRVVHGVHWLKNAPDCVLSRSMFYGGDIAESTSLIARGNNLTVLDNHWQFVARGPQIWGHEIKIERGSWENRAHGIGEWAHYAFRVGATVRDLTVRSMSFANFGSLKHGRVFELDPAAKQYTFDLLSGHVAPRHVPAGFEHHFRWHK